ncbi:MAG: hypothetical protein R6W73_09015 [Candidatus Saliniplasma sp.]
MEKKKKYTLIMGIMIMTAWFVLIIGVIQPPISLWVILSIITFLYYIGMIHRSYRRGSSLEDVVEHSERYMERRAQENLGKPKENDGSKDGEIE